MENFKNKSIAILGDGQLARMLAEAALKLNFRPILHSANSKSSAAKICKEFSADLKTICEHSDFITIENEFISEENLKILKPYSEKIFPSLNSILILQDKLKQKNILKELKIPTSEYIVLSEKISTDDWLSSVNEKFGYQFVLKWSRFGYDGKGTLIVKPDTSHEKILNFVKLGHEKNAEIYAESFVEFKKECAMVACRSKSKEFVNYPLVVSLQYNGICIETEGPAVFFGIDKSIENKAREYLKSLAEQIDFIGTFAVEFFLTNSNELIINEIAPRVHNTGHYSLSACEVSQFENHCRAISGLALGPTLPHSRFIMFNLLGPSDLDFHCENFKIQSDDPKLFYYWYEKDDIKPKRKLGHVNYIYQVDPNGDDGNAKENVLKFISKWKKALYEKAKK